jgi:MSHA pilin protein MshC
MRGFTLIELIMVMVIIGFLAAVVGPRFFDRQVFDERMFFEESIGAVRYAQKLALASGCLTEVSLDVELSPGVYGYRLRQADDCVTDANYEVEVIGADGQSPYVGALPANVIVTAPTFPIVFNSLGCIYSAAAACATGARTAQIGGFTLSVAAETGLVQ